MSNVLARKPTRNDICEWERADFGDIPNILYIELFMDNFGRRDIILRNNYGFKPTRTVHRQRHSADARK